MLFLRTVAPNGGVEHGSGSFRWRYEVGNTIHTSDREREGESEAWDPDWTLCGHGLHGLLNGVGSFKHLFWHPTAIWLIVEAENPRVIPTSNNGPKKYRFEKAIIRYAGNRKGAYEYLTSQIDTTSINVLSSTITETGTCTLHGGDGSRLIAGDNSQIEGGYRSYLQAGDYGVVRGNNDQIFMLVGDYGSIVGRNKSHFTCGDGGTIDAGFKAQIIAGVGSLITFRDNGFAYSQKQGIITCGDYNIISTRGECNIYAGNYCKVTTREGSAVRVGLNSLVVMDESCTFSGRTGTIVIVKSTDGHVLRQGEVRHLELKSNKWYKYSSGEWKLQ